MQNKKQPEKKPRTVAKAALVFGSGTLTSRILGLIREALFLALLPRDVKDAWVAAFRIPGFFRRLLGEGGLSVSFIPIYIETQKNSDPQAVKRLTSGVFALLMSVVGLICLLSFLFMETIVHLWLEGKGFTSVPGKMEMTVDMARIMVGFLFFITLFAYFMALLNGVKRFALSGFAPVLLNLSIISGFYFYRNSPDIAVASAWAVLFGGMLQAVLLFPSVVKHKLFPVLSFKFIFDPLVLKVIGKFLPTFLGVGVLQVLALINVYFASQLDAGSLTYMHFADRLLELPLSLIAVSIGTALLPTLSEYWEHENKEKFLNCIQKHFQLFYFLALPAAFGLWFIGNDIVQVLFVRGEFSSDEGLVVALILQVYSLTLLCAGSLKIFNQSFYASKDTLTPGLIAAFGLVVHVLMAPYWMDVLGIQGLVLSTALTTLMNLLISIFILSRRIGFLKWGSIGVHFLKCLIAALVMGAYLYSLQLVNWKQGMMIFDFPILIVLIGLGGVIYFVTSTILKVDEVSKILSRFKKK